MEDSQIIALFLERSEQAIAELDRKHGAAARKAAANILGDRQDAEECVNDALLGVWNSIPPQRPRSLPAYVCRIARNLAINRYRANTAQKRNAGYELVLDELAECIPSGADVETELEARELTEAIDRFLAALSREDRFLFVRRYWFADPVAELAALTGGSPGRVSVRLFRLREKLRKMLTKEGLLV